MFLQQNPQVLGLMVILAIAAITGLSVWMFHLSKELEEARGSAMNHRIRADNTATITRDQLIEADEERSDLLGLIKQKDDYISAAHVEIILLRDTIEKWKENNVNKRTNAIQRELYLYYTRAGAALSKAALSELDITSDDGI